MIVAFGCDHAGLPLKPRLIEAIVGAGHDVLDCGAHELDPDDDYPDYASEVGRVVAENRAERGVLVCGSGVGVAVAASKIPGVRAAMCHDTYSAHQGVEHDAMNVLTLGARVVGSELAAELLLAFLGAEFSEAERHRRRVAKIEALERKYGKG